MLWAVFLVIAGLTLLTLGGEVLLKGALALAVRLNISPAVIGLTVVAFATSVPELAVALVATSEGKVDIAIGNVVGSNIFNLSIIVGLGAVFGQLLIKGNTIKFEYPFLLFVSILYLIFASDTIISPTESSVLLLCYLLFIAYMINIVRAEMSKSEIVELGQDVADQAQPLDPPLKSSWLEIFLIVSGGALLAIGADLTVGGAVKIAAALGITDRVVGLTVVAIGTSLPEIVATLVSLKKGRSDVALGNALGSNLFNICGIVGISGLVAPLTVADNIIYSDHWWMIGITILIFPLMHTGLKITRLEGLLLLATYFTYTLLLIFYP